MTRGRTTGTRSAVDEFVEQLQHPRKEEIELLRETILAAAEGITEQVKWNAPSFGIGGDDRVTFRLQPGNRVQLIFHRGAKKRSDAAEFSFADATGLIEWAALDRGVVTLRDLEDTRSKRGAIKSLVASWLEATAD